MGAVVGLMLGVGLLLAWSSTWSHTPSDAAPGRVRTAWGDLAARAGMHAVSLPAFVGVCTGLAAVTAIVSLGTGTAVSVAVAFAAIVATAPLAYVRSRARRRGVELAQLWPDVVDDLTSAVRAGLTLPEAMIAMAERGPAPLRADMAVFAAEYRASGRFLESLAVWQEHLADPVADRLAATLRVATEVGGTDLGRMLRTLSDFLRTDQRTRGELEARQSWTVNGARLAVAAPWLVLALMSGRGTSAHAFDTAAGIGLLAGGAVISAVAYAAMLRIGRLPQDPRVLRVAR
ncbi:type II secretion system F family protein [Litorihabitans aurantiacus]|uniref:Type II secretion system protein F n=1 Tax=Litorihabitans aurantiacus TaxID=1930061 RepID=A0AA37XF32_9MICO|nr:type II secretion system F family protein [Litorihabitans aurantiacus]GMA32041.1 type II secretion system protein F [Litorihabitans aurantiacus]